MKRIQILFISVIMIFMALGCSKDHDAPTFATYDDIEKPTNVTAVYDKVSDSVVISWDMPDSDDIKEYFITSSDSSDFDFGDKNFYASLSLDKTYTVNASFVPSDIDSTIVYFDVSAVYDSETLTTFIGPRSGEPDSAMVFRK